jgi:hypothetical protein
VSPDSTSWYAGRYLGLGFAVDVAAGFSPGVLAGFLDAYCDRRAPDDTGGIDQRFHLGPAHAAPALGASAVRDRGGAWRVDDPVAGTRWYLGDGDAASFGVVQDLYCGLRRIAARRLTRAALLHAAAVQLRDRTLLFLGDKASGKSFASYACMLSGADHVASDKICMWASPLGLRCAGLIGSIRLAPADAAHFAGFTTHAAVRERLRTAARDPARVLGDKICLDPSELCRLVGVRPIHTSRPTTLVILEPRGDIGLEPIDPVELRRRLTALTLDDHGLGDPGVGVTPATSELLDELATACDGVRLRGRPPAEWFRDRLPDAL